MEKDTNKEEKNIVNTKEISTTEENKKEVVQKKKSKTRMILVIIFLLLFLLVSYISLRGNYLEYLELGEKYTNIFYTNLSYKYGIMTINFVVLYFIIYFTNRGIKKGLKPFFEKEKKEMSKLPCIEHIQRFTGLPEGEIEKL